MSVSIHYPAEKLRPRDLLQSLARLPGMHLRTDKQAVRGALGRGTILKSGHAHLEAVHFKKDGRVAVELELVPGSHGPAPTRSASLGGAIDRLAELIGSVEAKGKALVSGNFTFDLKRWEPTIPLPFTPPGVVDKMPGLPQICGLDFSFSERNDKQPLHRAFVTIYPGAGRMVVRLLLLFVAEINQGLPEAVLDAVEAQVPVFARTKDSGGSK